ncbi:MAG: hypothetical protein ACOYXR_10695 [Nitrospirota bacterium]
MQDLTLDLTLDCRVVALGASNLTRGFHHVVATARALWGPEVRVLAALGHGRSYGADSSFLVRTLPAILASGLWRELESRPRVPTRGLVTDVGNDILYGYSADQTLDWVREAVERLQRVTGDIVLTDLPIESVRRLSRVKFLALRSMLFPSCRLSLTEVVDSAERVNAGLTALAGTHGVALRRLNPAWYGFDPIHIRPSCWRTAWQEILDGPSGVRPDHGSWRETVRLYLMPPHRRWLFGVEQLTPQPGIRLPSGIRVQLY